MSAGPTAEVAVVGAGVAGLLVARELVRAGRDVLLIERGGLKPHADQLRDGHEIAAETAAHNHEAAPGTAPYPWDYAYGVGGSTLRWTGISTRFLPSDFELRTRFGVGEDWPFSYAELAPYYAEAERALGVAGGANPLLPGLTALPQPPHPSSRVDELLRPLLEPWVELQQARPTRSIDGRPPCCGSARCRLCPVDARFSGLHLWERDLAGTGARLLGSTAVARLRAMPAGVSIDCVAEPGEAMTVHAEQVVLAAGGIENASILLRSGLGGPEVGRRLFDHAQRAIEVELEQPVEHGFGTTLSTGVSYAYADGDWRGERGSLLIGPYNPGRFATDVASDLASELLRGARGAAALEAVRDRFARTLVLSATAEDVPNPARAVTLSPTRDRLGLPLNRISYDADSTYLERSWEHLVADLRRRLAPLGIRSFRAVGATTGGHQLGTCPFGLVVDEDCRVQGAPGVFAVGGSAFPTYSAAWPTLTICALAIRLGRRLATV